MKKEKITIIILSGVILFLIAIIIILLKTNMLQSVLNNTSNPAIDNTTTYTEDVNLSKLCMDSDGGIDFFTPGNMTFYNNYTKKIETVLDRCYSNRAYEYVAEGYCGPDNEPLGKTLACDNGCRNGACVKNTTA